MDRSSESQTLAERRATLEAFARALHREGHVLAERPELLWQQLYNRLQWADEPIPSLLAPELARRTARGARPWLRLGAPFRESEALIRSLEGHGDVVVDCAISPDGSYVVGAAGDSGLHVWDARTGVRRATLLGWSAEHRAWAISPDGSFVVSAGDDQRPPDVWHWGDTSYLAPDPRNLIVWDAATGAERMTLRGYVGAALACAVSPDGAFIVSAGDDPEFRPADPATHLTTARRLTIWDAATGAERATVTLPGYLSRMALHPRRPVVVCGERDGAVYFVELFGLDYRPIVVTPVDVGDGPAVHCPTCSAILPLEEGSLGHEATCPRPDCGGRMRVNPFVVTRCARPRREERMSEALTWQEFQQSELFSWFGVHEVGRTSDGHGRVAVRLEPGGNQEHIDLEVELDGNEIVHRATLLLDRAWVGQGQRINPFASDIAKGFLLAVAPGHTGARELAAHIEHIMSRNADIVGAGGPTPPSEPSPTVAAALNVYLGQGEHAELADAGAGVVVQNVTDAGRPRVRLEVTATGGAEAALDESGDQVARKPWWRFWQRG